MEKIISTMYCGFLLNSHPYTDLEIHLLLSYTLLFSHAPPQILFESLPDKKLISVDRK